MGASILHTFDMERFRLPCHHVGDLGGKEYVVRPDVYWSNIRGPIPWAWVIRASGLPGPGLVVALGSWYLVRRFRGHYRASGERLADVWGLGPTSVKLGLRLAESAGLVHVQRSPGQKLELTLREVPEPGRTRKPLRGPIPWAWWETASKLGPGPARVGIVCWAVSGWEHSRTFVLDRTAWADVGLSPWTVTRGLVELASAGLVTLDRSRGRSPVVRLQERKPEFRFPMQ